MNAYYSVFSVGSKDHTLVYNGYWIPISDTDTQSVVQGIARIMADIWYEEGQDAVKMMRINAPYMLQEMDMDASLIDGMIDVATAVQEKGTQND